VTQLSFGSSGETPGDRPREVVIYCDGGARGNPGPAAIGAVVLDPSTDPPTRLASVSETIGITTNNVAEYRALIAGLEAAAPFGATRVRVRADSLLVIRQVAGQFRVKQAHLRPLYERARELLQQYDAVDLQHVPREQNTDADALVNAALDAATH
jgi:ribonuclease HI